MSMTSMTTFHQHIGTFQVSSKHIMLKCDKLLKTLRRISLVPLALCRRRIEIDMSLDGCQIFSSFITPDPNLLCSGRNIRACSLLDRIEMNLKHDANSTRQLLL